MEERRDGASGEVTWRLPIRVRAGWTWSRWMMILDPKMTTRSHPPKSSSSTIYCTPSYTTSHRITPLRARHATPQRTTPRHHDAQRTHKGQLNRDMEIVSIDMRRREIESKMAQITEVGVSKLDQGLELVLTKSTRLIPMVDEPPPPHPATTPSTTPFTTGADTAARRADQAAR